MISIVIPIHNGAYTLTRCLASVFAQAKCELEVIVIDDGSTDSTQKVLAGFAGAGNLRVLRNDQKRGASHSRNRGIAVATARWVMFVDADDEIPTGALHALEREAESSGADIVIGAHLKRTADGATRLNLHGLEQGFAATVGELSDYVERYAREPYIYTLLVHCWGKLFRRSVIAEHAVYFDEALDQLEDVHFNFNFLRCCASIRFVDNPCYIYSIWQGNSMSDRSGTEADSVRKIVRAYEPIGQFLEERCGVAPDKADGLVKKLLFTTAIIWLLRIRKKLAGLGIKQLANTIRPIVNAPLLRESISAYTLMPRDSRLVYWGVVLGSSIMCALLLHLDGLMKKGASS